MQVVVLQGGSKVSLKLLTDLAKQMGIKVKFLSDEEREDIGLIMAIKEGRTGKHVNTENLLKKLRK